MGKNPVTSSLISIACVIHNTVEQNPVECERNDVCSSAMCNSNSPGGVVPVEEAKNGKA